ncbi:MAG: hypothetical protein FJ090_07150 [Deltaproteobacteria bacterium]|nr:hypothetical protein [Deltaproteobacteria bacterium]
MKRFLPLSVLALITFSGCSNEFTLAPRPALTPEQVQAIVARAHASFDGKREMLQKRALKAEQHARAEFSPEAAKSGRGKAMRERMRARAAEKSTAPVEDATASEAVIDEQVDG